ncbi:MAG: tetratricopeptide repeat protein, partial [Deltaproteobacteria bacterium]|nr:tetratricopeptide repeat protein [Deltaproteobacteria bacterium]
MLANDFKAQPWLATAEYFLNSGDLPAAEKALLQGMQASPDHPVALALLGRLRKQQGRDREAARALRRALRMEPENPDFLFNLALFQQQRGNLDSAEKLYLELIARFPGHADALANLGRLYQDRKQPDKARQYYLRDLELRPEDPDSHFNLAFIQLLTGNYAQGWPEYEWRFKRAAAGRTYPHQFSQPRWQGENLSGRTLLVHGEQGFGDNLQFLRYLPLVKEHGGRVLFEVANALYELLRGYPGCDRLLIFDHHTPCREDFDFYIPLLSLPGLFQTGVNQIPAMQPPLAAPPAFREKWRQKLAG